MNVSEGEECFAFRYRIKAPCCPLGRSNGKPYVGAFVVEASNHRCKQREACCFSFERWATGDALGNSLQDKGHGRDRLCSFTFIYRENGLVMVAPFHCFVTKETSNESEGLKCTL